MIEDAVWDALSRGLKGEYDIVARLGLGSGGAPVYLARELVTDTLVALRLPPLVSSNEQESGLEVIRQINASLPEIDAQCPHCGKRLHEWARFCPKCGKDVSGIAPSTGGKTPDVLRTLARNIMAWKYEVIGEMTRADGGGAVYFGRETANGDIVGLTLDETPDGKMTLRETRFVASDPTIQISESRRTSGEQHARMSPANTVDQTVPDKETAASRSNTLAIAAVILLLVMAALATCKIL